MIISDEIAQNLQLADSWTDTSNVNWHATASLDLRELTVYLTQFGARFVTITATQLPGNEGFCMEYLWDLNGKLHGFAYYPPVKSIPTICDICEAADWIEREIHDEFDFEFIGHSCDPLLLREGNPRGVLLHEVSK